MPDHTLIHATVGNYGEKLDHVLGMRPADAVAYMGIGCGKDACAVIAADVLDGPSPSRIRAPAAFIGYESIDTLVACTLNGGLSGFMALVSTDTQIGLDVVGQAVGGVIESHFADGMLKRSRTTTHNGATHQSATRVVVYSSLGIYTPKGIPGSRNGVSVAVTAMRGRLLGVNRVSSRIFEIDVAAMIREGPGAAVEWIPSDINLRRVDRRERIVGWSKVGGGRRDKVLLTTTRRVFVFKVDEREALQVLGTFDRNTMGIRLGDNEAIAGPSPFGVAINVYNGDGSKDMRIISVENVAGTNLDVALTVVFGGNWGSMVTDVTVD